MGKELARGECAGWKEATGRGLQGALGNLQNIFMNDLRSTIRKLANDAKLGSIANTEEDWNIIQEEFGACSD